MFDLLSREEQDCLMRCSVVRTFDENLFNAHFRAGPLRLADLTKRGWIEASNGRTRRYWVSRFLHADAWGAWWPNGAESSAPPPDGLKVLSRRVAAYCAEHGWRIEQIRQLAIFDPNEAWRLFSEQYGAAEADLDLAYAQDLIDALKHQGRTLFLSPALRDELDAMERRITTRAMRENDYYQTRGGRFQAREDAQREFRRLLGTGEPAWMLQLFGRGGIGKTTLLRWFTARACVTEDRTVPCAVINCDEFDPVIILSQPWLLLIEAAEQLSGQLRGSPFLDLVESFGHFRSALRPGAQRRAAALDTTISDQDIRRAARDVEDNFCRNAPRDGRPFVIALDGLDQVTLESRAESSQLDEMISMLRRIHHDKGVSDLRVVLAGRDALHKLLPELDEEPGVSNFPVRDFNLDETASYLKVRGIPDRDRIEAIYSQSSIPMIVALYADWLADSPNITAEQIRENREPQIYYLISRILSRIANDAVRDTLLYSVAVPPPAMLDFEFFSGVMLPLWRQRYKRRGIPGSAGAERQQRLWDEVLDYASNATATWISATETPAGKAVTVHDDVRLALLAKVRDHQAFADLHQRAADFYQEKATASGEGLREAEDWPVLVAHVVYHRVQRGDPGAIDYWRAAVARCRARGRTDWVQALATAITRQRDFRGSEGVSDGASERFPGLDGEGLPDRTVLAPLIYEAYVELAWLAAQDNGSLPCAANVTPVPGLSPVTSLANAVAVRGYAQEARIDIAVADYEAIVSALLAIEGGDPGQVLEDFHPAPGQASGDAWLVRARARAGNLGPVNPAEAASALGAVLDAYEHACDRYVEQRNISYASVDAGQWLLSVDRPDLALEWASRAEDAWGTVHPEGAAAEVKARALLALGRPGSALAAIDPPTLDQLPPMALTLAAEAQLVLRRPRKALDELREANGTATSLSARMLIDQDLVEAKAHGMLIDSENAMRCFSQAERRLLEAGQADPRDLIRICTARALFELRTTGSIHQARSYLDSQFDPLKVRPGSPAWTDFQLAKAALADRVADGKVEPAERIAHVEDVRRILDGVSRLHAEARSPAGLRVRTAVAGLNCRSLPASDRRRFLATLVEELARVTPPARMALLAGLVYCRPVELDTQADRELAQQLRALVVSDEFNGAVNDIEPARALDQAWQNLISAQVLRVIGERGEAGERRAEAMLTLEDPFVRWDVLAARPERLDKATIIAPEAIPPSPHEFRDKYGDYPVLFAAYITEWAFRADRAYIPQEIARWLRTAEASLMSRPGLRPTAWKAKLFELIAGVESPFGDPADHRLYDEAMAIWVSLGVTDPPSPEGGLPRPPAAGAPAVELILTDHESGAGVLVQRGLPGHEPSSLALPDISFDVKSPALDWGQRVGRLASLLLHGLPAASVRLDFGHPVLAARPWELTVADKAPLAANPAVRDIYRTGPDPLRAQHELALRQRAYQELDPSAGDPGGDLLDPERWAAIRAELRQRATRPLRVCLVQPMAGGSLDSERRFIDRRLELRLIYQRAFSRAGQSGSARALDFQSLYGDEVLDLYTADPPIDWADVVHVITVMEATEEMPVLNLDTRKGPPMTAPQLDFLVQRLSKPVPPLVIIDVQAPPSPVEARRHLLMRNRFAQQLLALGTVSTIIASGLTETYAAEQWGYIARGLAAGQNAAEICRKIQTHEAPRPESGTGSPRDASTHAVVFQATALFTNIHPDWLLEPGLFPVPSQASLMRRGGLPGYHCGHRLWNPVHGSPEADCLNWPQREDSIA